MRPAILFDLDGTLLSTLEDIADSVNATLDHFGCPRRTFRDRDCLEKAGATCFCVDPADLLNSLKAMVI